MQVFLHICAIFLIIAFYEGFFSALSSGRFFCEILVYFKNLL